MCKKLFALLCALMLLPSLCLAQSPEEMNQDEVTELLWEMYQTENEDAEFMVLPDDYQETVMGKTGIFNLLLIGVDTDNESLKGRSDTMLLASLNARTGDMRLISFMRDTYVSIPGKGHNKLNAAYSFGGAELLIQTLEHNFGVHVDGYLSVNYSLMVDLVDEIGGVTLTVSKDELPKLNGILEYYNYQHHIDEETGRLLTHGTQTLTGLQTMSYARIRKLDSDFVRVERQQRVVLAIYKKICQLDFAKLADIALRYMGRVGTDITLAKATELMLTLLSLDEVKTASLRIPSNGAYSSQTINESYYIVPKLTRCREDIHQFLYEYTQ